MSYESALVVAFLAQPLVIAWALSKLIAAFDPPEQEP